MKVVLSNRYFLILFSALFLTLQGCKKEYLEFDKLKQSEYNPEFAVPIANAEITMQRLLDAGNNNILHTDETGLITLVYQGSTEEFTPLELFPELNHALSYTLDNVVPSTQTFTGSGTLPPYSSSVDIDFPVENDETIRRVHVKEGRFIFTMDPNFPDLSPPIKLNLSIPSIIIDGQAFQTIQNVPPNGDPDSVVVDLAGAYLDLTKASPQRNKLTINYTLTVGFNSGDEIKPADQFNFGFELRDIEFHSIFGDFKQRTLDVGSDSILLGLFANSSDKGNFRISDPEVRVHIENSVGIPIEFNIKEFYSRNTATGDSFPVVYEPHFQNPFPVNAPVALNNFVETDVLINKTNSNLDKVLEPTPKYVTYDVEGTINYGSPPYYNFITDESKVRIQVDVELPLVGSVLIYPVRDTVGFGLGGGTTVDVLKSATIDLRITNGLPIGGALQVYMLDNSVGIIDTLVDGQIFEASEPTNGRIDQSQVVPYNFPIKLTQKTAESLSRADDLIIQASLNSFYDEATSGYPNVRIYDDYRLKVELGLVLEGGVEF